MISDPLLVRLISALPCLAHFLFDHFRSGVVLGLLAWPGRIVPACRTPDLRAFTAIRSFGGGGSNWCAAPQRRGSSVHRQIRLLRLTDNRLVLAGSSESRRALDRAECHCRTNPSRLSSAFVPFSVFQSGSLFVEGGRPSNHPASAFGCAPAVLGTTPLRRRLTSSRRRPWNGKTDHASPASFSVAFRYRFRIASIWSTRRASMKPTGRQRSWDLFDPSQLCSCMTGERFGRPDHSNPACRFMNVRPAYFVRGIDRLICSIL